ncbi:phosphoenolpyruvate--protein phosphotransferase [Solibacillus sp. R5-41]|uniref:phosphoenolpyruvate--protein phosphotransferase n=1 Tax=Solibacillus sp. R5-41 TaxID=2048654 RepID=UPI000C12771D|nr:phosphoenolpyruvate--protein phosphotransferase [Solibacillus sp. R5-41]ATP41500.1 phosphoenolpyruvate--protein phosphotransferase [Solibacillus sp. R5-41]
MLALKGIPVSNGVAIAKGYCLVEPDLSFSKITIQNNDAEIMRLNEAIEHSKIEIERMQAAATQKYGEDKGAIFGAHLLVLQDPELFVGVAQKIQSGMNAEHALDETVQFFIQMFEGMDNDYMKERAADIRDVSKRVMAHLLGVELPDYSRINEAVIIVAKDLTPSMTTQLDPTFVKGFITDIGGKTSHTAILARTMGIPAVVGAKSATMDIKHGEPLIIDGSTGEIFIQPNNEQIAQYKKVEEENKQFKQQLAKYSELKSISKDGYSVELAGNIGKPQDVASVLAAGGEGIGLFRTEFLYMDRLDLPSEEEQFTAYKEVLEALNGKPVVVRTLDIGGDKNLPYLNLPHEMNPFLGYRAIRLCLDHQELFRIQLRALLRASVYGNLKVMFPMIATLEEFRMAKTILEEEKEKLLLTDVPISTEIEIGLMIEIPSAAIIADLFAKEADFLSIGTNDLIQYTLAADRMNENVSYLYQPYHPAILRLVKMIIDAGHAEGKWVGMCGEMAGDKVAIPILLALGLDEFSMSASSILTVRSQLATLSKELLVPHVQKLLQLSTAQQVEQVVIDILK